MDTNSSFRFSVVPSCFFFTVVLIVLGLVLPTIPAYAQVDPYVISITPSTTGPTNATSVTFTFEFSKNMVIHRLLQDIFEQIYLKYRAEYLKDERIRAVIKEHRSLLQALRKSDVKEAMRITREHIRRGMQTVIETAHTQDMLRVDEMFLTTG